MEWVISDVHTWLGDLAELDMLGVEAQLGLRRFGMAWASKVYGITTIMHSVAEYQSDMSASGSTILPYLIRGYMGLCANSDAEFAMRLPPSVLSCILCKLYF